MMVFSLIPAGFYQFVEGIRHGIWYARSPEVTGSSFIHTVTWMRVVPDLIFDAGALALLAFVVRAIKVDLALRKGAVEAPVPGSVPAASRRRERAGGVGPRPRPGRGPGRTPSGPGSGLGRVGGGQVGGTGGPPSPTVSGGAAQGRAPCEPSRSRA
jgi:hypothetical protein